MRSYYLLSLSLLLLACQQQDLGLSRGESAAGLLEFTPAVLEVGARYARLVSSDIDIATTGFTAIGYKTTGLFSISDGTKLPKPNVFNVKDLSQSPLKVLTINSGSKYQTALPEIEHEDGSHLSFFAWAQASGSDGILATTNSSSQEGYPWLDVTVALPSQTQRDVVGANTMNLPNEYVVSAVDLDFRHLLSKLTFKIKAPAKATVTIVSTQCSFGANKVYQKGRFTFNDTDTVGIWGERSNYLSSALLTPSGWQTPKLTSGNVALLGELLLLPQKVEDGFLTLTVNYTLSEGGVVSAPQSRKVVLRAADLLQGRNYVYTLSVNADDISLFNVSIAPWIEGDTGSMPLVPGPKGDVVLLLDGNEPPYLHTDGKLYWLDASGWNNHCLIDNSRSTTNHVTYNPDKKGYFFHSQATGGDLSVFNVVRVPDLGTINGTMSCELVAELDANADASYSWIIPFYFSPDDLNTTIQNKTRALNFQCQKNAFTFDFGATSTNYTSAQRVQIPIYTDRARKAFYALTRGGDGRQTITYNDQYHNYEYSANGGNNSARFTNGVIGNHWKGVINYVKITKNQLSRDELKSDYAKLKTRFGINADAKFVPPPPITRGLMLCLDGRSAPMNSKWKDLSIQGRDATISNSKGTITHRDDRKCYAIRNGKNRGDIITVSDVGDMRSAYTAEFAAQEIEKLAPMSALFHFYASGYSRSFFVHYPYNGSVFVDSPQNNRIQVNAYGGNGLNIYRSGGERLCVTRQHGQHLTLYKGLTRIAQVNANLAISTFSIGEIGIEADVYLFFLRFYNRVLTDEERRINYEEDNRVHGKGW